MYATGARAQEICDLRVCDICKNTTSATVTLTGKGSKTRQVGISKKLAETIQKYIKHRHIEKYPEKHIFSSQTHQTTQIYAEMSQDTVDKKLREWNETWFGNNSKIEIKKSVDDIPDFLRKK